MNDNEELRRRIETLENENRALRNAASRTTKGNLIVVTEGNYQGHPTITFEAGTRPFTLGVRKASIVLYCQEYIHDFVKRHKAEIKDWDIVRGVDVEGGGQKSTDVQI